MIVNNTDFCFRKKISPPVADVIKQQSNTSLSQTNGNTHDLDLISPSSNDDSSQDAQTYDERIDAVIDSVIAMADSDKNIESMIDNPLGFKDDSNSKEGKVMDEASAPKLPQNMPKDLEETIQKLKKVTRFRHLNSLQKLYKVREFGRISHSKIKKNYISKLMRS